jgi:hypothetical protein
MPIFGLRKSGVLGFFGIKTQRVTGTVLIENFEDTPTVTLTSGEPVMDVIATANFDSDPYGSFAENQLVQDLQGSIATYETTPQKPNVRRIVFQTKTVFKFW